MTAVPGKSGQDQQQHDPGNGKRDTNDLVHFPYRLDKLILSQTIKTLEPSTG